MVADIEVRGSTRRPDGLGVRVNLRTTPAASMGRIRRAARAYAHRVYGRHWTYATTTADMPKGQHRTVWIELTNLKLTGQR